VPQRPKPRAGWRGLPLQCSTKKVLDKSRRRLQTFETPQTVSRTRTPRSADRTNHSRRGSSSTNRSRVVRKEGYGWTNFFSLKGWGAHNEFRTMKLLERRDGTHRGLYHHRVSCIGSNAPCSQTKPAFSEAGFPTRSHRSRTRFTSQRPRGVSMSQSRNARMLALLGCGCFFLEWPRWRRRSSRPADYHELAESLDAKGISGRWLKVIFPRNYSR